MSGVRTIDDPHGYGRRVTAWDCHSCSREVQCYPGERAVTCPGCDTEYNPFGQRLRAGWRDNPSNHDAEVSDLDGYESSYGWDS